MSSPWIFNFLNTDMIDTKKLIFIFLNFFRYLENMMLKWQCHEIFLHFCSMKLTHLGP